MSRLGLLTLGPQALEDLVMEEIIFPAIQIKSEGSWKYEVRFRKSTHIFSVATLYTNRSSAQQVFTEQSITHDDAKDLLAFLNRCYRGT